MSHEYQRPRKEKRFYKPFDFSPPKAPSVPVPLPPGTCWLCKLTSPQFMRKCENRNNAVICIDANRQDCIRREMKEGVRMQPCCQCNDGRGRDKKLNKRGLFVCVNH